MRLKSAINRYVLQFLGLAYEVRKPQGIQHDGCHSPQAPITVSSRSSCSKETSWLFENVGLRAGWYMLEVEHSRDSIGCVLTLTANEASANDAEHYFLRLTSKSVCKRIIRVGSRLFQCKVSIDQPHCGLDRLTLTAMTPGFAFTRMKSRLSNRGSSGNFTVDDSDKLYQAYQEHVHDGIVPRQYIPEDMDDSSLDIVTSVGNRRPSDPRLLLIRCAEDKAATLDPSVDLAVGFARQHGWSIDWHGSVSRDEFDKNRHPDSRSFIMPVVSGVQYRRDVFHQLLLVSDHNSVLVYADHDHLDDTGDYLNPVLKPEWNPDLLLNINYVQLPWMICEDWARIIDDEGQYTEEWLDILLLSSALGSKIHVKKTAPCTSASSCVSRGESRRQLSEIKPLAQNQVQRIPKVLASVRSCFFYNRPVATAHHVAWQQRVNAAFRRAGRDIDIVSGTNSDEYRINWPLPAELPSVDIVIPTRDHVLVLKRCIDSVIQKTNYGHYRILVVDNDSQDFSTERYYRTLENEPRVSLLRHPGAFNYSAINNFAVSRSDADVLVLLNNDTEVIGEHWLDELVRQALRPEIGCVGAKLYYSNGRIQHGGVIVGIAGIAGHAHRYSPGSEDGYCRRLKTCQNLSAVTAACLAVKRTIFLEADGLDEEHLAVAWNDVDFCLKVQSLGYRNLWTPHAHLYHHEGLSRGADDTPEKIRRVDKERGVMLDRWQLNSFVDPAYHPLLTREHEAFGLGKSISQP